MNWFRSFLRGVGSIFTIAPSPPPKIMSDREALDECWKAVGSDFGTAIRQFAKGLEDEQVQPPPEIQKVISEHFWELTEDKKDQPKS